MSHIRCPNGNSLSNCSDTPMVWAFRLGFFRDFLKLHPNHKLEDFKELEQIYDYVEDVPGEVLEYWYCDECKGFVVFVDIYRYDFKRME